MLLSEIFDLNERLSDEEAAEVAKWKKRTPSATEATDHFFGKGVEDKYTKLKSVSGKSPVHKAIEEYLGRQISSDEYKSGQILIPGKAPMKIGKLLNKSKAPVEIMRGFENDTTRQGKTLTNLVAHTSRSAVCVAGQTSGGQSWEQESCKHYSTGGNKSYLPNEVRYGTVVHYLEDENGTELARATSQPHHNNLKNIMYQTNGYYGVRNKDFMDYVERTNKELSGEHKGGNIIYKIHPKVYNNNDTNYSIHPQVTKDQITDLLRSPNMDIRAAAAEKTIDIEEIKKALADKVQMVRERAAMNPHITKEIIDSLISSNNQFTIKGLVQNPALPKEYMAKILSSSNIDIRIAAIQYGNLSKTQINDLLSDNNEKIRAAVVQWSHLTNEQMLRAMHDPSEEVRISLMKKTQLPSKIIDIALDDESVVVRKMAVRNTRELTNEQIDKAQLDDSWVVRQEVSSHIKTAEQLERAVNDNNETVRQVAAHNKGLTSEQIDKLVSDESGWVRGAIASNKNLTHNQIDKLLRDESEVLVASTVAKNPSMSHDQIEYALNNKHLEHNVRSNAIINPSISKEQLDNVLRSQYPGERKRALSNPSITKQQVETLINDDDEVVRKLAKSLMAKL